ncbi:penicillin acylase family protein [Pengzhenrongella frigida]|uniref:Penicillin acylase family protein n=1 Tax=Pengzhenrongella frigida TaxID=1259133 RepID=A0A4Q5MXL8_9MICO|nr:penicillin acylase family protein [Cellulomonas sp. HLT2-17]RYV50389.1 penicillin acylase family protein [Cellulomonas sp. HLT2-17]
MPRRRAVRLILVVAGVVVLALIATSVLALVVVRRPLPQVGGTLDLPGLTADVDVVRDARGVPQITAETSADLFRAQGFVHAQDRFFEMDYRRHVTAGRISELVGENADALEADTVIRTFGWRRVAEQEWDLLLPSTREYLQAYADGVNAYLETRNPDTLGIEYTVLGLQVDVAEPEPWDPIDSLAWLKAMAWDLRGNYDDELDRATSFASVRDIARVDELFPAYRQEVNAPILASAAPTAAPVADSAPGDLSAGDLSAGDLSGQGLASDALQDALTSAKDALAAVPHLLGEGEGVGSNSWVVAGEHTASGLPILANDPHLAISAPGVWSQVGLHCAVVDDGCPFDVTGFSFAGFPGVVIGHNDALAWGITNLGADVTDFFLERTSGEQYLREGERRDVTTRTETIKVNGADDVEVTVRSTGHGPIISGVLPEVNSARVAPLPDGAPQGVYEISLGWTALTPGRTADAVFAIDLARTAADIAAAATLFEVPSQNIVFATTDGHIGYQAPGKIPVRAAVADGPVPSNGTWPRPGWDSRYDWQGYVEAADMPAVLDPPEGFIVAANQAVTPTGAGPFLTSDWDFGYRSQRVRDVLVASIARGDAIDGAATSQLQLDDANPYATMLVPMLLSAKVPTTFDRAGQDLLRGWDGHSTTDSAAAAYFASVWSNLLELTFWDDLPDSARPDGGSRWLEVVRGMLERPDDLWWDDRTTVGIVEGRDEILSQALTSARRELTVELGKDPSDWNWGKLHTAAPEHAALGGPTVPAVVRRLVNPDAIAVAGGSSIVNATSWDAATDSFAVTKGPSMRMVVDLADLDASTWVTLTGTSGHPASAHYSDQFGAWARGETYPWPYSAAAVDESAADRLTLRSGA